MIDEIGSEFWSVPSIDRRFLLSGRTALDFIIRDIVAQYGYKKALLPSFCCHTMIEPFLRNGFKIRFYDVYYHRLNGLCADIPEPEADEVFYLMKFFGFGCLCGLDINKIRNNWPLIVEDCTHSWMMANETAADYSYTSYRKWAGFYGIAEATKRAGSFIVNTFETNRAYYELRKESMDLKSSYILGREMDKSFFLDRYNAAETLLEKDYSGYSASEEAIQQLVAFDKEYVKKKRIENAKFLIEELKGIEGVHTMFDELKDGDVPLFVPVFVESARDELRRFLIDRKIYCPVHWPVSEFHSGISSKAKKIYEHELSLVCDQRYDLDNMKRIAETISEFFKGNK